MRNHVVKEKGERKKAKPRSFILPFYFLLFTFAAYPQRVAVLAPDNSLASRNAAGRMETALAEKLTVLDESMAMTAFNAAASEAPFNLTKEGSKRVGAAIGCDYFVLVRAVTLRRSSSARPEYFEASAAVFAVSSRSGRLVEWKLLRLEASTADKADKMLAASIPPVARTLAARLKDVTKAEIAEPAPPEMEEPPEPDPPAAKNFRAPIPYRRVKPEYTMDAYLFDIAATVEIVVDLDASGVIKRTEIVRWAGYGLDESVEKTVRGMNWRPAERNGKPLPMRFLVRYNFKKIEKEETSKD